jgi:hypothetical protein
MFIWEDVVEGFRCAKCRAVPSSDFLVLVGLPIGLLPSQLEEGLVSNLDRYSIL